MRRWGWGVAGMLAELSPVALLGCREDGRIVWSNRVARGLLDVRPGDRLETAFAGGYGSIVAALRASAADRSGPTTAHTVGGAIVEIHIARGRGLVAVAVVDVTDLHNRVADADLDELTGLPNRRVLDATVRAFRRAVRTTGARPALILADLDHFKMLNDSYGHAAGDEVLVEVARRIVGSAGDDALVGRIGGEEFLICLSDGAEEEALEVAARVTEALEEPIRLVSAGCEVTVGVSMGVAVLEPMTDVGQWYREADEAMYRAKRAGRGTTVVYAPTEGSSVDVRRYDQEIARLRFRAERDDRTGLLRDVAFREDHPRQVRETRRDGVPLSLMLVDLDRFHAYNSRYLYDKGHEALRAVATSCRAAVRETDEVYRYGGDELAVLLPGADRDEALVIAERIRGAVEALRIEHSGSSWGVLTVSIGVCTDPEGARDEARRADGASGAVDRRDPTATARAMIHGANRALLDVKAAGRNGCRAAPPQDEVPPVGAR